MFSVHLGLSEPPTHYRQLERADEDLYEKFRAAMFERGVSLIPGRWYVGMGGHGDEELALAAAAIDASFATITSE